MPSEPYLASAKAATDPAKVESIPAYINISIKLNGCIMEVESG